MNEKFEHTHESDVDRMLDEVYGHGAVEMFNEILAAHPDWSLEQALKDYEENPTGGQTSWFRERNLLLTAHDLAKRFTKDRNDGPRILEVGCSTGEETYSLAVHLFGQGIKKFSIRGIDVTSDVLKKAKNGEYKLYADSVSNATRELNWNHFKPEYFERKYFIDSGKRWKNRESSYKYTISELARFRETGVPYPDDAFIMKPKLIMGIGNELKKNVSFAKHDILEGPYSGTYDIVVMNNVLLHYPPKSCDRILKNALLSLYPGGFLVIERRMAPMNDEEKKWLTPYNEWRLHIEERFPIEEVAPHDPRWDDSAKSGEYYRFLGWNSEIARTETDEDEEKQQ